jgi:hypothetical protein
MKNGGGASETRAQSSRRSESAVLSWKRRRKLSPHVTVTCCVRNRQLAPLDASNDAFRPTWRISSCADDRCTGALPRLPFRMKLGRAKLKWTSRNYWTTRASSRVARGAVIFPIVCHLTHRQDIRHGAADVDVANAIWDRSINGDKSVYERTGYDDRLEFNGTPPLFSSRVRPPFARKTRNDPSCAGTHAR